VYVSVDPVVAGDDTAALVRFDLGCEMVDSSCFIFVRFAWVLFWASPFGRLYSRIRLSPSFQLLQHALFWRTCDWNCARCSFHVIFDWSFVSDFFFFLIRFFLDFFFIVLVSPSTRARPLCRRFGVSCDGSRMFPRTRASFMRYRVLSRYLFFLFFFFFSLAGGLSRFPPPRRRVILRLWVPFVPFIPVPMMTTAGVVRFIGLRWFSPGSFFCAVVPVFSIGTTRTQPPFLLKWQALIFRMACRDFMCRPILFFVRLEELGVPCFAGVV